MESDLKYITEADLPWESFKNKTVLISGASGFLPSYMVETLLYLNETRQYGIRILGLVRNFEKAKERFSHHKENKNLILIAQDVCDKIKIDENIDYIIHAASQATPRVFLNDPVGTIIPNVIGTNNLLNLAAEKKVEGFLFFSTTGVYGFMDEESYPAKENCFGYLDPMDLASCYIESKRMGENMCVAWMRQYGVPVKIIRPAITYGPGVKLDDGRSFADFISNIINHQDIEILSDGKALRSFCYLADATLGFFTIMLKGKVGEAYNVAADREISIIDLAKLLAEKVFPERKLNVILKKNASKNYLRMNFARTAMDVTKAKELGWKINFSLEEGFKRTVRSFEE
ncbi:MAG TPA: NAD-dependent epimerase/dehydratase family protein [Candidatus Paceibacterota bacterium]